jgi:type VI secretion system protein ImpG
MQDDLLLYYERELTYLRKLGAEFAQKYPKVAARLQLESSKTEDPHVERLLEGFAFLAARVHRRLDDDFPEISEALLGMLHPQLVRPVPAMCIVDMPLDPAQGRLPEGHYVPRGSVLHSRPYNGVPCVFRTTYDATLWPMTVTAAGWTSPDRTGAGSIGRDAVGAIRLELRAFDGVALNTLSIDALRLHLAGDASVADTLYELLLNNARPVIVRNPDRPSVAPILLAPNAVTPVGFGEDEQMLPYSSRTFRGYNLLLELFTFPEKFRFVDVHGFGAALRALGATDRVELSFLVTPFERAERRQALELELSPKNFRTSAVPAVNLFEAIAEPILLTERAYEHVVIADARRHDEVEVWSVDSVKLVDHEARVTRELAPLYSHRHHVDGTTGELYWHTTLRRSVRKDKHASATGAGQGTETPHDVWLSFTDLSGEMRAPDADVVSLSVTCSNGNLPKNLPFGVDERGDFELLAGGPIQRIECVVTPTKVVAPKLGDTVLWRLISSLSLNHLSLTEGGPDALRELLRLHNVGESLSADRQIDGLVGVRSAPAFARVAAEHGIAFARGRQVDLEFDEEQFPGGGMYLMATVLERFLALYASMNSFTKLSVRSRQRRRLVADWPARAGWRTLL